MTPILEKAIDLLFTAASFESKELGAPPSSRFDFMRWLLYGGASPAPTNFLNWRAAVTPKRPPNPYVTRMLDQGSDAEQQFQIADAMFMRLAWARYGFNVFDLTDSLASALLLTRTGAFEGLAWPFPAFVLRPPPNLLTIKSAKGEPRSVAIVLVHRYDEGLRISAFDENKCEVWVDQLDDWYVRFSKADDIEMLYETRTVKMLDPDDENDSNQEHELRHRMIRLAINFVSWLATRPFREASSPSNKAAKQAACERKTYPVWSFGKDVKLPAELRETARRSASDALWEQQARYVVRGHFRRKPGVKNSTDSVEKAAPHQKVWIAPFWKGPEESQTWTHIYKTSEKGSGK